MTRICRFLATLLLVAASGSLQAEESVEYVAEHLLEVAVDARYSAFPLIPRDTSASEARLQLGYASFDANSLNNQVLMSSAQYFLPVNKTWGLLFGAFYDHLQLSGGNGAAKGEVLVVNAPNVPRSFDIDITDVSGSGAYIGGSLALTYTSSETLRWQFGIARSNLNIDKFRVEFDTRNLPQNFAGSFDYAAHYGINTAFVSLEKRPEPLFENFSYSPHGALFINTPRVGFEGRFSGPDFDYSGNTDSAGNGKHIPDVYLSAGVVFEYLPNGLQIDLGTTLFTYLIEPYIHKGIRNAIFLTISAPIF